jgi:hypothetical protein
MSMATPPPALPYAWVRSHGVMLAEAGGAPVLLGTAETAAWAVAELRRRHGPLPFQVLDAAEAARHFGDRGRRGGARHHHLDRAVALAAFRQHEEVAGERVGKEIIHDAACSDE